MNCIAVILFVALGTSIIPDGLLPVGMAAVMSHKSHGLSARFVRDAQSDALLALAQARDRSIQDAHNGNDTARATADKVKEDALKVTLAAVGVALAGVANAPVGDVTAAALLAGANNDYNAAYVPAEAAHAIAYAAAHTAAVIAINIANATYATAVAALG